MDGGQSHTEAVVADERGMILGRGFGGPSNHAEQPGGRERLRKAVADSADEALRKAGLPATENTVFESAHFGMTGGADFKEEIITQAIKANRISIGHDGPTALFGSTAGQSGIVAIAGTGSVVYGENTAGETAKIGGLGYLFSDEGSGFWLATQVVRLAIKEQDGMVPQSGLELLVLDFFQRPSIRDVTNDFYNAKLSRDDLAAFAKRAQEAAANGNVVVREQIRSGANVLVKSVKVAAERLNFSSEFPVAYTGGMFRGEIMRSCFAEELGKEVPNATFTDPIFGPAIGALLLAFRQAGIDIGKVLLNNLKTTTHK
ncbi:MAG: BadF/BadG/BcrA/BcrD ATPase family protein [Acidobacteriota bacterium]